MQEQANSVEAPRERRQHERAATARRATLQLSGGGRSICQATTVDLSSGGLRLTIPRLFTRGSEVEIELDPARHALDQRTIRVRGRVAWCEETPAGGYACGVSLSMRFRPTTEQPLPLIKSRIEAEDLLRLVARQLPQVSPEQVLPLSYSGRNQLPTRRRTSVRWRLLLLLFFLLLLLVLLCINFLTPPGVKAGQQETTAAAPVLAEDEWSGMGGPEHHPMGSDDPGAAASLARSGASEPAPRRRAALPGPSLHDFFVVELEATRVARPIEAPVVSAALNARQQRSAERVKEDEDGGEAAPYGDPLTLATTVFAKEGPPEGLLPEEGERAPATRISVDTSRFLLTVYDAGGILGVFPVGLGLDGRTPEGAFVVANKIRDPAWFNRGKSVPPGDQRNPLGALWMGLGDHSGPLSYGIHPTREARSIGDARSRGCIRMRPEDAERVFEWCAVGTPIQVGPGQAD
ncbi:MAG: L,D-transpeptidase family protein [Candidatus Hydrogenedentes bacterium]|nr:L,D-transpeptidase family protein [Candidatus Hydrogenedentota bacterium]